MLRGAVVTELRQLMALLLLAYKHLSFIPSFLPSQKEFRQVFKCLKRCFGHAIAASCSKAFLENLVIPWLFWKLSTFYGTQRFIAVFTRTGAGCIHSTPLSRFYSPRSEQVGVSVTLWIPIRAVPGSTLARETRCHDCVFCKVLISSSFTHNPTSCVTYFDVLAVPLSKALSCNPRTIFSSESPTHCMCCIFRASRPRWFYEGYKSRRYRLCYTHVGPVRLWVFKMVNWILVLWIWLRVVSWLPTFRTKYYYPEEGGGMSFRNAGNHPTTHWHNQENRILNFLLYENARLLYQRFELKGQIGFYVCDCSMIHT
jgi:hypothetical protein